MGRGAHSSWACYAIGIILGMLAFVPTSARAELLISVSFGPEAVRRYDETSGTYLGATGTGGFETISAIAVRHHKDLFVAYHDVVDIKIRRYDIQTAAFSGVLTTISSDVGNNMAVAADGNLYFRQPDGIRKYDANTGQYLGLFASAATVSPTGVASVFLKPGSSDLFANGGQFVRRFDLATGALLGSLNIVPTSGSLTNLTFGPDGNIYAENFFGGGSQIVRFDGSTGALLGTVIPSGTDRPFRFAFGPDGNVYAAMLHSGSSPSFYDVRRYNAETGAYIDTFIPANPALLYGVQQMLFDPVPEPAAGCILISFALIAACGRKTGSRKGGEPER